jgi:hypothetical protein
MSDISPEVPHDPGQKEQGKEIESVLITPDHLISLFRSSKFHHALKIAADETQHSGNETDFDVMQLEDGAPYIESVNRGHEVGMNALGGSNTGRHSRYR